MAKTEAAETPASDDRIFTDPAIAQTVEEDPMLRFLAKHGKNLLVVAGIVAIGFYVNNRFRETRRASIQRASDLVGTAGREFKNVARLERELGLLALEPAVIRKDNKEEENKEQAEKKVKLEQELSEAQARLEGNFSALRDERAPFSEIAEIYRALNGSVASQASVITPSLPESLTGVWQDQSVKPSSRMLSEVAALVNARVKLDREAEREAAILELNKLAASATYVNVAALATLAAIATDEASRRSVEEKISSTLAAHPEQRELLEQIQSGAVS